MWKWLCTRSGDALQEWLGLWSFMLRFSQKYSTACHCKTCDQISRQCWAVEAFVGFQLLFKCSGSYRVFYLVFLSFVALGVEGEEGPRMAEQRPRHGVLQPCWVLTVPQITGLPRFQHWWPFLGQPVLAQDNEGSSVFRSSRGIFCCELFLTSSPLGRAVTWYWYGAWELIDLLVLDLLTVTKYRNWMSEN